MCGIFGFASRRQDSGFSRIAKELMLLSESRGKEASGFAAVKGDKIIVHKTPHPASALVKSESFSQVFERSGEGESSIQAFLGHSRLVTDGYEHDNKNNQPYIKHGFTGVHNGIIVNKNKLWMKLEKAGETRETDLDSELIPSILHLETKGGADIATAFGKLFENIYGMTNIALFNEELDNIFLATNNGSIYYLQSIDGESFVFGSERHILDTLIENLRLEESYRKDGVTQLNAASALCLNLKTLDYNRIEFTDIKPFDQLETREPPRTIRELVVKFKDVFVNTSLEHEDTEAPQEFIDEYLKRKERIGALKRCSKCLLPETFPFIEYDDQGVCNYCHNYQKISVSGMDEFKKLADKFRRNDGKPECLMPFSGGRDSSYCLHLVVKELGMKPIAYSYDWGMLTDLARRNQARMCGKLGVEHILISADIRRKRGNIRKNVSAWLKRPNLGTIPLFMAGDKQYFYYANLLMDQNGLDLSILGENMLETTRFKTGFCGIKPKFGTAHTYTLTQFDKMKMMLFYGKQYLLNPSYINSSVIDTLDAFKSYYVMKHQNVNLFDYVQWDEAEIENVLLSEYDWETDPGTKTTWRIGDGTAAFYNYIYYMVAGFTENDTFRSNQIREGTMTREEALEHGVTENAPRWDSLMWYCKTIQVDFKNAVKTINDIKTLY